MPEGPEEWSVDRVPPLPPQPHSSLLLSLILQEAESRYQRMWKMWGGKKNANMHTVYGFVFFFKLFYFQQMNVCGCAAGNEALVLRRCTKPAACLVTGTQP